MTVPVVFEVGAEPLHGDLTMPPGATGVVIFAHGSGSSRHSPRNIAVARTLQDHGLGTVLFDLLAEHEDDRRFDIDLLVCRLLRVIGDRDWGAPIGLFGASTGAAAALGAAATWPENVRAVVSRGGRPDLAGEYLPRVAAPTLLIVGGEDRNVLAFNEDAAKRLGGEASVRVVPGATHLFEEPGALEAVAELAAAWFTEYLR